MADSDCELERTCSLEKATEYDQVPVNTEYILKFKNCNNKTYKALQYTLKQGKTLPYTVVLKEKIVHFTKTMQPSVRDMKLLSTDNETFTFQDEERSYGEVSSGPLLSSDSGSPSPYLSKLEHALSATQNKNADSLAPVGCLFCSHKFLTVENAVRHVKFSHPGWEKRQDLIALEQSSGSDVTVNSHGLGLNNSPTKAKSLSVASSTMDMNSSQDFGHNSSTVSSTLNTNDSITIDELELDRTLPLEGEKDSPVTDSDLGQNSSTSNILNNPNWFLEMKTNFRELVVATLTKRTRDAIDNNDDIEDTVVRRRVQLEILGGVVTYLQGIFGPDTPRQKHTRQVADLLATEYPAMFQVRAGEGQVPAFTGYGLGGFKGLKGLPERICNLYRDRKPTRQANRKLSTEAGHNVEEPVLKKARNKQVYGVINNKFYAGTTNKSSLEALKQAKHLDKFDDRETIFKENRPALMKIIRDSTKSISKVCDGFFNDPKHLEEQFYYLTESRISQKIEKGLSGHMENMEIFLLSVDENLELSEKIEKIKLDCVMQFRGSPIHKFIHLLREAGNYFDGDGTTFMRLEDDGNPRNSSPHILARKLEESYVFELWVEKECIMGNMGIATSIASFFHLVFCFNLKYPKESETVCDFLQRTVADFGNDEGTKTNKSKATAESKLVRYQIQLGKVLGARNVK